MNFNDVRLLERIKNNDKIAFEELVNRYSEILFRFIYSRIKQTEDAQDIVQDVFFSLWNRRSKIHIKESLYPYLFKASKYEVLDWIVKNQRKINNFSTLTDDSLEDLAFETENLESILMAKELERIVENEIDRMSPTMKKIINMSRTEALSIGEISEKLDLSTQTVKNNLSLARKTLKMKLR